MFLPDNHELLRGQLRDRIRAIGSNESEMDVVIIGGSPSNVTGVDFRFKSPTMSASGTPDEMSAILWEGESRADVVRLCRERGRMRPD